MELIRKLPTRKNKNGHLESWAIFKCSHCLQEVERRLKNGKRQKSCGCMQYKFSSEFMKEYLKNPENNPMYGKKHTEKTKKDYSDKRKGEKNSMYGIRLIGELNGMYGKKHTKESNKKNSESHIGLKVWNKGLTAMDDKRILNGKDNPNWNNGSSFEPYGIEFNKEKKTQVLERDNYTCQNPNCEHLSEGLDVHHIDYDKKNNSLDNLTTLCDSCHTKTNGKNNREHWIEFYQNIMINRIIDCLL